MNEMVETVMEEQMRRKPRGITVQSTMGSKLTEASHLTLRGFQRGIRKEMK